MQGMWHCTEATTQGVPPLPSALGPSPSRLCLPQRDTQTWMGRGLGKLSSRCRGEASDPTLNFAGKEVKSTRKSGESGLPHTLRGAVLGAVNQSGKEAGRWEDGVGVGL